MNNSDKIKELIDRQDELVSELRGVRSVLCSEIEQYEGSLREALKTGLVKLNFPAPPGFNKYLRQ